MSDNPDRDEPVEFASFIVKHDGGRGNRDITEALAKVADAVSDTDLAGSVTVKISVKKFSTSSEDARLAITVDVTPKVPTRGRPADIWYADSKGGMHRDSPTQFSMFGVESFDPRKDLK